MIILPKEKIIFLHAYMTRETGGEPNMRDEALLSSAVASAYQTFDGTELYPTIEEKAARLGYALIANHAFVDGNKRIGMFVMLVFLEINNAPIRPTNDEVVRVGLSVASGKMGYDELLSWIRNNSLPSTP